MPHLLELMKRGWPSHICGNRIPLFVPLPYKHKNLILLFSLILVYSRTCPCSYTSLTFVNMNQLPPFIHHCRLLPPRRKEGIQELALNKRQKTLPRMIPPLSRWRRTVDKWAIGLGRRYLHGGLTARLGRGSLHLFPHWHLIKTVTASSPELRVPWLSRAFSIN